MPVGDWFLVTLVPIFILSPGFRGLAHIRSFTGGEQVAAGFILYLSELQIEC